MPAYHWQLGIECGECVSLLHLGTVYYIVFAFLSHILSEETECCSWRECEPNTTWEYPLKLEYIMFFYFESKIKLYEEHLRGLLYSNRPVCVKFIFELSVFLGFFCPQVWQVSRGTSRPRAGLLGPCVLWHSSPLLHSWLALCRETKVASMQVRRRPSDKTCSPWIKVS